MRGKRTGGYTVSGPQIDRCGYSSGPEAVSAAITFAMRCEKGAEATYYVRRPDGEGYGRVERNTDGSASIFAPSGRSSGHA
jgi:hypothetical protein